MSELLIGQHNFKAMLDSFTFDTAPKFQIYVGPRGSGRTLFAKYLRNKLNVQFYQLPDNGVESVRAMIKDVYSLYSPTLYYIPHADTMSLTAKFALLKVTEEPPANAIFVMSLQDENNTLDTIRSRATVMWMDRYTPREIEQYFTATYSGYTDEELNIVQDLCSTPREVDILYQSGISDFYSYVEKVVANIARVSLANSFKIGDKIALKATDTDKFDLTLFWRAFNVVCLSKCHESIAYAHIIRETVYSLSKLRIVGVNKQTLFDSWVLAVRKELDE